MHDLAQRAYFFDAGIRFTCRRCGACCTGSPGIVRVEAARVSEIASYLDLSPSQVIGRYLDGCDCGYRVKEDDDGRCLFFEEGCRIYPVRPSQCRTFPFWFVNLRSPDRWQAVEMQCPGIGTGRHYCKADILAILNRSMPQNTL